MSGVAYCEDIIVVLYNVIFIFIIFHFYFHFQLHFEGEAILPFAKQFLTPVKPFFGNSRNIGDRIDYGQRRNDDIGGQVTWSELFLFLFIHLKDALFLSICYFHCCGMEDYHDIYMTSVMNIKSKMHQLMYTR